MSDVQRFLLAVDKNPQEAQEVAAATAHRIQNKELKLVEVVQSLGEYLTDDDVALRAKAIAYLSAVLAALPPKLLTRQHHVVLCAFFCKQLEDEGPVVKKGAEGLFLLQSMGRFNDEDARQVALAMIKNLQDLQRHPQGTRHCVLKLLDLLMSKHREALKGMGETTLVGITDLVSGEKDPRNLMIIFSILKVIIVEWDIVSHVETLFDSVFCYFPITFRPPPDDPYGITAQDLKNRLRDCIASTKYFALHAFPALMDKLDSTSPNVKKDVLQTLAACALNYDVTTMSNYSITLWDSLKYEILNAQEEDLAGEALFALRAIAVTLSTSLTSKTPLTPLARYLRPITNECNEQLREPQQKQAKPAGQILGFLGTASPIAFTLIIKAVMAPLLTVYQDTDGIVKQRALLEVVVTLFDSAMEVFGIRGYGEQYSAKLTLESPLNYFKDQLFDLLSQALMGTAKEEVSFRIVALKGLLRISKLRDYLADNEIGMVVQYLDDIVLLEDPHGKDELKSEAIQALVEISKFKPYLIMDITFPAFMAKLPDSDKEGNNQYITTLEGLAQLSVERDIFLILLRRLLNKLDVVLLNKASPAYPRAILSCLLYVLSNRKLEVDNNLGMYYQKLVVDLISKAVGPTEGDGELTALNDETVLDVIGRIANLVVRFLTISEQNAVAFQIYTLFTDGVRFRQVISIEEATVDHRRTMILSAYLLAAIPRNVRPSFSARLIFLLANRVQLPLPGVHGDEPLESSQKNLAAVLRKVLHEDIPSTRLAMLRQVALITNKFLPPSRTNDVNYKALNMMLSPSSISPNSIRVAFWIMKALILKLDPCISTFLPRLLALLADPTQGLIVARGFSMLLSPEPLLTKENHCIIRALHKQKVFTLCVPIIASDFCLTSDAPLKANYLIALAGLLKWTPSEIIMSQLDIILPLLLQSLDLEEEPDVKGATIETLTVTVKEEAKVIDEHVGSLISRLLASATNTKKNPPRIRHLSLNALHLFALPKTTIPITTLLPYKRQVIKSLMVVLDDPKRNVRKAAVDCRSAWERIDDGGEE
ncbi:MAG: hypothetical protein M1827_006956 [Pycnora praestabilis]|nr:MAG: hypothetical protein M1827_006956 [Pycnora praestabilis]